MISRFLTHSQPVLRFACVILLVVLAPFQADAAAVTVTAKHVILVVVDGLRPDKMAGHTNFDTLAHDGTCTYNARADPDISQTLPNHISMFTSQLARDHLYMEDMDNGGKLKLQNIFNLVKDAGGSTGFFGSKDKFDIFDRSWDIDTYVYNKRTDDLVPVFVKSMLDQEFTFSYLHIRSPDKAGHRGGGADTLVYRSAVQEADDHLGAVLRMVESSENLRDQTAIILTSDHGFQDDANHGDEDHPDNFRIPFCVYGNDIVSPGVDLYDINKVNGFVDPGDDKGSSLKVVRNVNAGAIVAAWLGVQPESGELADQYLLTIGDVAAVPAPAPAPVHYPAYYPTQAHNDSPLLFYRTFGQKSNLTEIGRFSPQQAVRRIKLPTRFVPSGLDDSFAALLLVYPKGKRKYVADRIQDAGTYISVNDINEIICEATVGIRNKRVGNVSFRISILFDDGKLMTGRYQALRQNAYHKFQTYYDKIVVPRNAKSIERVLYSFYDPIAENGRRRGLLSEVKLSVAQSFFE